MKFPVAKLLALAMAAIGINARALDSTIKPETSSLEAIVITPPPTTTDVVIYPINSGSTGEVARAFNINVRFFVDSHYTGKNVILAAVAGTCHSFFDFSFQTGSDFDNQVSSFYVEGGFECSMYKNTFGCTGGIKKTSDDDLSSGGGGYNNVISSFRCYQN